ncbi:MAG TPA: TonB-dependent receptor [Caulobacteraceae bacterium]|jgi:outer membrane receptor protein involved in Fe transport
MKTVFLAKHVGLAPAGVAMLLASTCLTAGTARAADAAAASGATVIGEVVVTAEKRSENLQKVPMSITAIDTKKLDELHITQFQDYVKFLPSVSIQTFAPGQNSIYIRGVSDGGNANHSGPEPIVGTYLDEQPVTTINGSLDVHIYDIARVEVLEGPQGTLYGASSEAGTVRIITNKPSTAGFSGALDVTGNWVDHGGEGYVLEGFVNIPITDRIAVRLVAFDEYDPGFIDNVPGTRPYVTAGSVINNAAQVKKDFNPVETYGGRAALKFDINDNWSITPSIIAQDQRANGFFGYNPAVGDLQVQRFQPDSQHDRWYQAALTINGKIGRFDLTYAGGYFHRWVDSLSDYTDYSVAYDQASGYGAYWTGQDGLPLANPSQFIVGRDRYEKGSNELRIASPATDRFRVIAGLFQERQSHWIIQDYVVQGFGAADVFGTGLVPLAVPGWAQTLWLTDQDRVDRDEAAFGEASFDITPQLTITGGIRYYHYDNSLFGFYGYSQNFDNFFGTNTGFGMQGQNCEPGRSFRDAPCVNLDKDTKASGETHKVNLTWRIDPNKLVYFTYATGFRPGGVNRNGGGLIPPYQADTLTSYEVGWKTSWLDRSLNFNGALYDEEWNNFQFAYLGINSLTIIQNAPSARILGAESNIEWRATPSLTISAAGAYNDAELAADFCTDPNGNVIHGACGSNPVLAPKGQQLAFTPKFKGTVTARYTFPIMGWDGHAQVSVGYQTSRLPAVFSADNANLGTMPGYATVDFSVGAEHDKSSVELFVKNAFDERGQIDRFTPCTTAVCAPGYPGVPPAVYVIPTQPLTIGLRVGQKF